MPAPDWLSDADQWQTYLSLARRQPPWRDYPDEFFARLAKLSKRARLVAWRLFEDGSTSTQVLFEEFGYAHAPRAARDIRDCGIRTESARGRHGRTGRPMAVYSFAPAATVLMADQAGRAALPQEFTVEVLRSAGHRCSLCCGRFEARFLQADHRVPYAIVGDDCHEGPKPQAFMAVCRSCNRAKSWTCEHCPNWGEQQPATCSTCYWAYPECYQHIATEPMRRLELIWQGGEIAEFDVLRGLAERVGRPIPAYVKAAVAAIVASHLEEPT